MNAVLTDTPRTGDPRAAAAVAAVRARSALAPRVGVVLGSGLGAVAESVEAAVAIPYGDLPGFPAAAVGGHAGRLLLGRVGGTEVAVLQGRAHYYEDGRADAMAVPIRCLAGLGCEVLLLTNAAGSLRREWGPGSVMLITDHIGFAGVSPLIGARGDDRFVDMVAAYDPDLCARMRELAQRLGLVLREGVYLWARGPQFETPAEIRAARTLGADAIGMSTVPEVILARHVGLRVVAVSLITNLAAGLAAKPLSHAQTLTTAAAGAAAIERLLHAFLERAED
jgi:purine nucleotide phosphorylase